MELIIIWENTLFVSEVHPLLGVKGDGKSKKKTAGRPKGSKGKDKDFPFRPKPYKGEQSTLSVETLSGSGLGGGGGGMKGRAEGGLATGKFAPGAESGSCADTGCLQGNPTPSSLYPFHFMWTPNCKPTGRGPPCCKATVCWKKKGVSLFLYCYFGACLYIANYWPGMKTTAKPQEIPWWLFGWNFFL